jgi:hypothetical protein
MFSDRRQEAVGYYSVVRFIPDPQRDEAVNIGLLLVNEGSSWARLRVRVPKTRLTAMGHRDAVESIERWEEAIAGAYEVDGEPGLTRSGRLSLDTLSDWSSQFGGIVRLTAPKVAIDGDMESLWGDLFRRYVGRPKGEMTERAAAVQRPITGVHERRELVETLLSTMRQWKTFDPERVVQMRPFPGLRGTHVVDVAVLNGAVTAVAQALPLVHGTESEVIQTRALLVDAAVDLDPNVLKIGLYDDPPADRQALLVGTRAVFDEIGEEGNIDLLPRRRFDAIGAQLENRFFPELG